MPYSPLFSSICSECKSNNLAENWNRNLKHSIFPKRVAIGEFITTMYKNDHALALMIANTDMIKKKNPKNVKLKHKIEEIWQKRDPKKKFTYANRDPSNFLRAIRC